MKIKVETTFRELMNAPYINTWEHFCEKYGYNIYIINEGLVEGEDVVVISFEDAKFYGLIKNEKI